MAVQSPLRPRARLARPASLLAVGLLLALPQAWAQSVDPVLYWNSVAGTAPVAPRFGGPYQQFRVMAMVQIAVHDALNSIDRRYDTYSVVPPAPAGASSDAAIAAATHAVVLGLLPDIPANAAARTTVINAYTVALAAIPDGAAEDQGVAAGHAAAAAILAARANDGSATPHTPAYAAAPGVGVYLSTVDFGSPAPQFSGWGAVLPFAVNSASQFRVAPGAIFDVEGTRYASEYNQVKQIGDARKRASAPDSEQSDIARWWAGGGVDWQANARLILAGFDLDAWQQAHALALMSLSIADATINNAESKYHYAFWRPVTAIRWADDGNPDTAPDPSWLPFITTPPYPDYPCNSTSAAGAAATALRLALGTNHAPFTRTINAGALPAAGQAWPVDTPTVPAKAITRSFHSLNHAAGETARSRVYAGIHFYEGCKAGLEQGGAVAEYLGARVLQPVD